MIPKNKPDEFANRIVEITKATIDKETERKITMILKIKKLEARTNLNGQRVLTLKKYKEL